MNLEKLEQHLVRLRFVSIIAVIASGLGSVLMFIIGAIKVFRAYVEYFSHSILPSEGAASGASVAIVFLVQAIDAFLIAIGLMIFGGGIYNLFVHPVPDTQRQLFGIQNIAQLKSLLAELIVVILIVKFLEEALHIEGTYEWDIIVLPAGVLLIAIAVRILRFKESEQ